MSEDQQPNETISKKWNWKIIFPLAALGVVAISFFGDMAYKKIKRIALLSALEIAENKIFKNAPDRMFEFLKTQDFGSRIDPQKMKPGTIYRTSIDLSFSGEETSVFTVHAESIARPCCKYSSAVSKEALIGMGIDPATAKAYVVGVFQGPHDSKCFSSQHRTQVGEAVFLVLDYKEEKVIDFRKNIVRMVPARKIFILAPHGLMVESEPRYIMALDERWRMNGDGFLSFEEVDRPDEMRKLYRSRMTLQKRALKAKRNNEMSFNHNPPHPSQRQAFKKIAQDKKPAPPPRPLPSPVVLARNVIRSSCG